MGFPGVGGLTVASAAPDKVDCVAGDVVKPGSPHPIHSGPLCGHLKGRAKLCTPSLSLSTVPGPLSYPPALSLALAAAMPRGGGAVTRIPFSVSPAESPIIESLNYLTKFQELIPLSQ